MIINKCSKCPSCGVDIPFSMSAVVGGSFFLDTRITMYNTYDGGLNKCCNCYCDIILLPEIEIKLSTVQKNILPCVCGAEGVFKYGKITCGALEKKCLHSATGDYDYPVILGGLKASAIEKWNEMIKGARR